MKYLFKILNLSLIGLLLSGCSSPQEFKPREAISFYKRNESELLRLRDLISRCRGKGDLILFADGTIDRYPSGTMVCPNEQEVRNRLAKLGILWANVSAESPDTEAVGAVLVLTSVGTVAGGHGSAIYYYPTQKVNPFGDSTPLDGSSGHWFFRSF